MDLENKRIKGTEFMGHGQHIRVIRRVTDTYPLHSHDYFEIELFIEGNGVSTLNSEEYKISRGSLCILTPADFHDILLDGPNMTWNISFDESVPGPAMLEKLFSLKRHFTIVDENTLKQLDLVSHLISEETNLDCIRYLLSYLLDKSGLLDDLSEADTPINRALLYMQTYFRNDPSLSETAAHVGLSPSYFGALFHSTTGETYISYLNKCKINCAMRLLDSGKTVTETCFDSGFGSLSGFRYIFKQKTGMTPTEYLEK